MFYFRVAIAGMTETLVLCSLYSPADEQLNQETHGHWGQRGYYPGSNF